MSHMTVVESLLVGTGLLTWVSLTGFFLTWAAGCLQDVRADARCVRTHNRAVRAARSRETRPNWAQHGELDTWGGPR